MEVSMQEDGRYLVTLERAEAHVLIWGGSASVVGALDWDLRHKLVEIEDTFSEDDYKALMNAVDALPVEPSMPTGELLKYGEGAAT